MPDTGIGGAIGLGEESTWGTAVSRTVWRPAASISLSREIVRNPRPDLFNAGGSPIPRGHFTQEDNVGGTVRMIATYDNVGMLLKHALGAVATTGPVGSDYTHTYTLGASLPTGLTIEAIRGDATNSEVFEGCKIDRLMLEAQAGQLVMCEFDFIGQTSAARGSAGTPSYGSTETLLAHSEAGQLAFNAANYDPTSLRWELRNNLTRRPLLGSTNTAEPVRGGFASVQCSVNIEAVDALYTAMTAGTQSDLDITFTNGSRTFQIVVQNAYNPGDWRDSVTDAGIIQASGTFIGESDGTDLGFKVVVVNEQSSGIAN